jgi:phosphoribosylformylglycinamidine synthase
MKVIVKVRLKSGILDPQGKAVNNALHHLGFDQVRDVRIGKYIEMEVEETDKARIRELVEAACNKLLANPVIEDYEYEIVGESA